MTSETRAPSQEESNVGRDAQDDRRAPTDRRNNSNRLLKMQARRWGLVLDRREDEAGARKSWLSFLIPRLR